MRHIEFKFDGLSVINNEDMFSLTLVGLTLTIYKK